ncbi:MAG: CPBP family intramembrane metalloprotease [Verrucomicrobia bacterium]|nr:CPBP family intramembrane metalloprotease [Verrucomicrobiota bacterium]
MRPVRAVALYFLLIFLGSALLTPWLYLSINRLKLSFPALETLADEPFPRYFSRTLMALGLIGLWPLTRALGFRSWQNVGLGTPPSWGKECAKGFLLGFGSLAFVVLPALVSGARAIQGDLTLSRVLRHLGNAGAAAIVVSCLEEIFFRGVLFGGLRKRVRWPTALAASSLIYAALHFLHRAQLDGPVDWTSGFVVLGLVCEGFLRTEQLFPGFVNLTLAGMILGLAYQRAGVLYYPIGLHAGWIFWLKTYGFLSLEMPGTARWFWGTGRLVDGCLASAVLASLLVWQLKAKPNSNERSRSD